MKTPEEELNYAIEELENFKFHFACFVDAFKRYLEKAEILKK